MSGPKASLANRAPTRTVLSGVRCGEEFRADERLLRVGSESVRVVTLSDGAVSYGVGVREDAPFLVRARVEGVPVARRSSGGSGVLHAPGDLAWSVVLPRTDPRVGRDFVRGYGRLGAGVIRFLNRLDIEAAWVPPPNVDPDFCVLSGRGQVLSARQRVLGGAAQHLSRSTLLHHGMLALTVDRERIARLFSIPGPVLAHRLTSLRELGITNAPEELAEMLARELGRDADAGGD